MINTIIFDMDGLIIDSERVTYNGYVHEFEKYGIPFSMERYKLFLGKQAKVIRAQIKEWYGDVLDENKVADNVNQYIQDTFENQGIPLKQGLVSLLQYLKKNSYTIVLATSSSRERVNKILAQAGLTDYFTDSICGDEIKNGKPHPDIFLKACEKVGSKPEEALVLEDSESGILASYRANIPVLCVPDLKFPDPEFAEKATKILTSLDGVLPFLLQIKKSSSNLCEKDEQ
ncbi:HAD family hydrolase [Dubosiella newyorkensis]|uniref:HAD family hydrolase n=1 Tax=Dubosiella newyorkensis TaxID=1862672 RepID=UPI0025864C3B|nr:HAD family phosphatase [Dubosiella newyorkensis]